MTAEAEMTAIYALQVLLSRTKQKYVLDSVRPDEVERNEATVDFLARDSEGRVLAIEHTLSEPYDGQITDFKLFDERLGPVRELVTGHLPEGVLFDLVIQPGTAHKFRPQHAGHIAAWIVAVASSLGEPPDHFKTSVSIAGSPPISLGRRLAGERSLGGGQVGYRIAHDDDQIDRAFAQRLRRSFEKKLPKLEAARNRHNATETLLILEHRDIQVLNPLALLPAMSDAAAPHASPDHIIMVGYHPPARAMNAHVYRESGRWLNRVAYVF
jgi:hypothetical protein